MTIIPPPGVKPRAGGIFGTQAIPLALRYARDDFTDSNGTDTSSNMRTRHLAVADALGVRVAYVNFGTSNITLRSGIEYPLGTFAAVYFNGARSVVIEPGGLVLSDVCPVRVTAATPFWVRTWVSVTSGLAWRRTHTASETSELGETGTPADKTISGTITGTATGLGPWGVYFVPAGRVPSVSVLGDSIVPGTGQERLAWGRIAFDGILSAQCIGEAGELAADFVAGGSSLLRRTGARMGNHVIFEYGSNDLANNNATAVVQASLVAGWNLLASDQIKVWQTTITPRTTSTDSWATLANQTVLATNTFDTKRVTVNNWLRDGAPILNGVAVAAGSSAAGTLRAGMGGHPLAGYVELADAVESARDSGKWKVDGTASKYTADGVHPSTAGHALMGAAVNVAVFT